MNVINPELQVNYRQGKINDLMFSYNYDEYGRIYTNRNFISDGKDIPLTNERIEEFLDKMLSKTSIPIKFKKTDLESANLFTMSISYFLNIKGYTISSKGYIVKCEVMLEYNNQLAEKLLKDGYTIKLDNGNIVVVE